MSIASEARRQALDYRKLVEERDRFIYENRDKPLIVLPLEHPNAVHKMENCINIAKGMGKKWLVFDRKFQSRWLYSIDFQSLKAWALQYGVNSVFLVVEPLTEDEPL